MDLKNHTNCMLSNLLNHTSILTYPAQPYPTILNYSPTNTSPIYVVLSNRIAKIFVLCFVLYFHKTTFLVHHWFFSTSLWQAIVIMLQKVPCHLAPSYNRKFRKMIRFLPFVDSATFFGLLVIGYSRQWVICEVDILYRYWTFIIDILHIA